MSHVENPGDDNLSINLYFFLLCLKFVVTVISLNGAYNNTLDVESLQCVVLFFRKLIYLFTLVCRFVIT